MSTDHQPWKLSKCVLPQHTDHAGVMWHGAYTPWLEEARIDALDLVGLPYKEISAQGFEMPVISLEINYKNALFHGDQVVLESWALPLKGTRFLWRTIFLKDGCDLAAEATVNLVLVRKLESGLRIIRRFPNSMVNAFQKLELGPSSFSA